MREPTNGCPSDIQPERDLAELLSRSLRVARRVIVHVGPIWNAMADNSTIEWTDATWNPVTGCTKISAGCDNCYAARFSERFRGVPNHPFETGFDLTLRPERLLQPLEWKRPRMIFVNSMSDLFHKKIPRAHIAAVFDTMEKAHWHIYQVLTKRSSLLQKFINERYADYSAPPHMWFGVSVENEQATSRIAHLQKARAAVRFLSIEPLIAPVGKLYLDNIHWVIVGGESGPGARPMERDWVVDIRNQCLARKVAFFFKQWGGRSPKTGGRLLDGKEWNQFPAKRNATPKQLALQVGV
jgi:protein gp37